MRELRPQLDNRDGRGGRGRGDRLGVLTFVTRRSTSEATKLPSPCMSYSFFCLYCSIRDARALCSMSYIAIGNLRQACASLHFTIEGGLWATAEALTRTRDTKSAIDIRVQYVVYS